MVEMVETAAILNQAGPRALVILDEIGRGTATYDGLSIAWAVLEHLHDVNRCRALFATHYHELTALAAKLPGLRNATVAVREWQGEVVFLHEVREGVADRSYGVQVARLAGLPARGGRAGAGRSSRRWRTATASRAARRGRWSTTCRCSRRGAAGGRADPPAPSAVEARLRAAHPDELSPREALALVYELRGSAGRSELRAGRAPERWHVRDQHWAGSPPTRGRAWSRDATSWRSAMVFDSWRGHAATPGSSASRLRFSARCSRTSGYLIGRQGRTPVDLCVGRGARLRRCATRSVPSDRARRGALMASSPASSWC